MNTEHSIDPLSASSVQAVPKQRRKLIECWPLLGALSLLGFIVMGGGAAFTLITQPPKPNCSFVLWPFAPASVRLYCAQELTTKPTLENLIEAIALVDALDEAHPLRGAINPRIESWSKLLLDKAEENFNAGELTRAIEFAEKVPIKTEAAKLVEERTSRWRRIWAEGESIDAKVLFALREENWRKAFGLMVDFLYVDNRYWAQTRYRQVTDIIFQAQKDETKVIEAEVLLKRGGFDNLEKAITIVRDLPEDTIFTLSRKKIFNGSAEKFVKIAEQALEKEDLSEAINALSFIPRESRLWAYSQDLTKIANATAMTWGVSSRNYQRAIESVSEIPQSSKLYGRAQALVKRWQAQIASVKLLEEAQLKALSGNPEDMAAAIQMAQRITQASDKYEEARDSIQDWSYQIQRVEDQPILDLADELSLPGDEQALRAAIAEAQRIGPSRVLFDDAQSRISYWRSRLNDLTRYRVDAVPFEPSLSTEVPTFDDFDVPQEVEVFEEEAPEPISPTETPPNRLAEAQQIALEGTPNALADAITTANQVAPSSAQRAEADREIEAWSRQLLAEANATAQSNPEAAITIAQRIPNYSTSYSDAQDLINQLTSVDSPGENLE